MRSSFGAASAHLLSAAVVMAALPAHAQNITITDAKIANGKLVVSGMSGKPNSAVTLDGQFTTTSNAAKSFGFNLLYHPDDCMVQLSEASSATLGAVIANCGVRGLNAKGAWDPTVRYAADDIVTSLGSSWRAKKNNLNKSPSANLGVWEKFAAKGDQGTAGPSGAPGAQGPKGATGPQGLAGAAGPVGSAGPAGAAGAKGSTGPAGATGPQGLPGAIGPRGAIGATGPQGPTGPTGSQGPTGPTGPQGPTGIIATYSLTGGAGTSNIAANSGGWLFVGPTPTIAVATGDRVTASAGISLGTTNWLGAQLAHSICYQLNGSGGLTSLTPGNSEYQRSDVGGNRIPFNSSLTATGLNAGSYKIGFCVWNYGGTQIDKVEDVNGWVMVTH